MSEPRAIERIGIFGGTFDPVHNAHLLSAECACEHLELDVVYFVPAAIPPHKRDRRAIACGRHRVAMLEQAIAGNVRFALLTWELDRGAISYTVDTLEHLRRVHEQAMLHLILGGDSVLDFSAWRSPERICELARIAAINRPGHLLPIEAIPGVTYDPVPAPLMEISSTDIRERIGRGASVRYRLPDQVIAYIQNNGLYR